MKQLLFLSLTSLLLASCTNLYYTSGAGDDDVYYDPSAVYPSQERSYDDYVAEPETETRSDDYWDESYADQPLTEEGDVYIENYYDGYVWDDPFARSRFDWYFPYRTSFSLYYSNFGFFYDPWMGWQAGIGWGWRPVRPWACNMWDPFWGYGWGGFGYTCNPWAYPFHNYWPMGWGYGQNVPYYTMWNNHENSGSGQSHVYGRRPSLSSGSSVNSGYTGGGNYTVDRHYASTKPLSDGFGGVEKPSKLDVDQVRKPAISHPGLPDRPADREVNPVRKPQPDSNRPIYDSRPPRDERPRFPETNPDRRPNQTPDVRPTRPSRDNTPSRPSRDNTPSRPSRGGGGLSPSSPSPSSPSRGGGGSGGGRRGGMSFDSSTGGGSIGFGSGSSSGRSLGSGSSSRSSNGSSGSGRSQSSNRRN